MYALDLIPAGICGLMPGLGAADLLQRIWQLGTAGRSLLAPANDAYVHAMHITTLIAALLALAGGFVVVRWMPGKPQKAAPAMDAPASDTAYEAELAILAEEVALNRADREG